MAIRPAIETKKNPPVHFHHRQQYQPNRYKAVRTTGTGKKQGIGKQAGQYDQDHFFPLGNFTCSQPYA